MQAGCIRSPDIDRGIAVSPDQPADLRRRRLSRTLAVPVVLGLGLPIGLIATAANHHSPVGAATPGNTALYSASATPAVSADPDRKAAELGLRFTAAAATMVTGIKFYKSTANTGRHTATLWAENGTALVTVRFSAESASGWQTATLARPVRITPGQTYVASYHTNTGHYSVSAGVFAHHRTMSDKTIVGTAGVYSYGSASSFPTHTWRDSSYLVDVVTTTSTTAVAASSSGTSIATSSAGSPSASGTPTPPRTTSTAELAPPAQTSASAPAPATTADFPNAANTGPRIDTGDTLQDGSKGTGWVVSGGRLKITGPDVTIQGLTIPFGIDVLSTGATIVDNVITARGSGWAIGLYRGSSDTTIGHNLIQGPDNSPNHDSGYQQPDPSALEYGIFDATGNHTGQATTEYNEFRFINHPMNVTSGTIRDNYMHVFSNPTGADHTDAIFSGGGDTKPLVIEHNTMINDRRDASAAVVLLSQAFGAQTDVTVDDNLMAGGGFILYGAGTPFDGVPGSTNITVTDNEISTRIFPRGGWDGVGDVLPKNGLNGNVISGNRWFDGPSAGDPV